MHGDSKFVVNSRVDVKVGLDGVEFLGASASEWVNGGIRILPGEKGAVRDSYPLYANLEKAMENSLSDLPTTTLTLTAPTPCRTYRPVRWCCIASLKWGK